MSIPRDVAVVGYDNNQAAWDSPIPITTIAQPGEQMGGAGRSRWWLTRPPSEAAGGTHTHRAEVLEPQLVVRESSASAG